MEPLFLGLIFAITWLSSSLVWADIETIRATERRLARCPVHA